MSGSWSSAQRMGRRAMRVMHLTKFYLTYDKLLILLLISLVILLFGDYLILAYSVKLIALSLNFDRCVHVHRVLKVKAAS